MVYSNNFVAVVKSNGKILRENRNTVAVPFGSEYSILLKNQSSVRAVANVWLDGVDVTEGKWVIVDPNGSLELERFIRNGNLDKGNKFKFIERTDQIEEHRGIGVDDGLVRVEYRFEVPQTYTTISYTPPYYTAYYIDPPYYTPMGAGNINVNVSDNVISNMSLGEAKRSCPNFEMNEASMDAASATFAETAPNEAGITVPGGVSHQKFVQGQWFATEGVSHVIVLKLTGKVKGVHVSEPLTVKVKPKCNTCGKVNKATHKFCDRCGTALLLL